MAVKREWLVVDAATAVEVHVSRALRQLVARSQVSSTALGGALLAELGDGIDKTWPSRLDWLSRGFGISIKGETYVQELLLVVDCRNAIVHASGSMTKQQMSPFGKALDLRKRLKTVLEIDVHATRLVIGEKSVEKSVAACRRFIEGFDKELIGRQYAVNLKEG
ncbi:hypothetical protein ACFWXO_43060 [Kitasatospora sp. NPDC059088]|uniref:hypothetical protein n=1 Tax=Kitasatospora sp. NPDC059088 TaxID=3346722 RepID=UPI0036A22E21